MRQSAYRLRLPAGEQDLAKVRQLRVGEELRQRDGAVAPAAQVGDGLCGQQRIAAAAEKVVPAADGLAEQPLPQGGNLLLNAGMRRFVHGVGAIGRQHRLQDRAVNFAVAAERQRGQQQKLLRHHFAGQRFPEVLAQGRQIGIAIADGHRRRQPAALRQQGHARRRRRPGQQRGLNVAQLDAVAAHFYLPIPASEKLQRTVRAVAGHVAGAVPALALVGDEAIRRAHGIAPVAERHARAADPQLAADPVAAVPPLGVHHPAADVIERIAVGHRAPVVRDGGYRLQR